MLKNDANRGIKIENNMNFWACSPLFCPGVGLYTGLKIWALSLQFQVGKRGRKENYVLKFLHFNFILIFNL